MKNYDVVVIGTGTAGQTAALEIAYEGYRVAVIEQSQEPGGVCALHGCQSKKYFYEAAEAVAKCSHLQDKGITSPPTASWGDILNQKNTFTSKIPENTVKSLKGSGIDYHEGTAVFTAPQTVTVGDEEISGTFIIIAAGAEPMKLPITGAEQIITSNEFLSLDRLPERIAFIGGGFISFEFAHFAARLGSRPGQIHILEAQETVLAQFDQELVQQLVTASETEGISIHTKVKIIEISKTDDAYRVLTESGTGFDVDLVVNGAGRRPRLDALNLEAAGVEYSPIGITVNNTMQTSNQNVYAVGDCAASVQLARVADMEAKIAAQAILNKLEDTEYKSMNYDVVPAILFTYPQLGGVGKSEEQCRLHEENQTFINCLHAAR